MAGPAKLQRHGHACEIEAVLGGRGVVELWVANRPGIYARYAYARRVLLLGSSKDTHASGKSWFGAVSPEK
jgi:hypothetical protein